jgi:hypothetical protein
MLTTPTPTQHELEMVTLEELVPSFIDCRGTGIGIFRRAARDQKNVCTISTTL